MKVAVEARALSAVSGGVKTYTHELIRHLLAMENGDEYTVLYDCSDFPGSFPKAKEVGVPRYGDLGLPLWLHWQVPRALEEVGPDVVHFTKAAVPRRQVVPTIVTIYDVIPILFPESQRLSRRWYWPRALAIAAERADHVVTISEASKRGIVRHLRVDAARVTVTPLAVDLKKWRRAANPNIENHDLIQGPYVLYVGTIEPRKNVPLLVRAFARIAGEVPHDLVIAGREYKSGQAVRREIEKAGLGERVKLVGMVADDDLPDLYAGADVFAWPSIYEGWGFPVQEAMTSGVPVVVSNGGALPEVVGQAGRVVPFSTDELSKRPEDAVFEEQFASALLAVLSSSEMRAGLAKTGREQVATFSWERVARQTHEVYRQVAGK